MIVTFESRDEILTAATIQMKATAQYYNLVLFVLLYKVFLTFESLDEILKCDHLDENVICKVARFCGVASYDSKRWF